MIKTLAIALTFSLSQFALAHELDETSSQADIIVVKTNVKTGQVEVARLNEKIPAGKAVPANLKFQKLAMNSEVKNQDVNSSNELDATSSTSSWGFAGRGGIAVGPRGGAIAWRGGAAWGGGGYYGGGYPGYGYGGGYGYNTGYYPGGYPYGYGYGNAYGYGGYGCGGAYYGCYTPPVYATTVGYAYQPYYGYYANGCNYAYLQGGVYY